MPSAIEVATRKLKERGSSRLGRERWAGGLNFRVLAFLAMAGRADVCGAVFRDTMCKQFIPALRRCTVPPRSGVVAPENR